ncbi:MAG: adenylate/guanylate cyclase domain-containing protein [Sporichthyaceae bacterium]
MPEAAITGDARAAAEIGDWGQVRQLLTGAATSHPLSPEDLDRLAWAAMFTGDIPGSLTAWQGAFAAFLRTGDRRRGGLTAVWLALAHFSRGAMTVGQGWVAQADRNLLADTNCPEYGWLVWMHAVANADAGADPQGALTQADEVVETGRRLGNLDVETLGLLHRAQLLLRIGEPAEARALLDQVMVLSTGGCLGPLATAFITCGTVSALAEIGDYQRAWDWNSESIRCSVGPPSRSDFPGDCRMHRAELLRLRGEWNKAELELASVCEDVNAWHPGHGGSAYTELGVLSLRRGDLDAAESAFAHALELGSSAQPGRTELALARGHLELAAASIRSALSDATDPCARAALLPVAVEVALANGQPDQAGVAAAEAAELALTYATPAHLARAAQATGSLALALGDLPAAQDRLAEALTRWENAGAPYEAARMRVLLAAALAAGGDVAGQDQQLTHAYEAFTGLGAVRDAHLVADLLGRPVASQRVERALMFTDIEGSTKLLAELGDDAWTEVLRWHDSALRQQFVRHRGVEVKQKGGGDGFFVGFGSAAAGLDCALDIQQAIRTDPSGLLRVRVGVHWARVLHSDGDFSGRGVHEAARISALGRGGEVLTSRATLIAAAKDYPLARTETVELRGLPGHTEVAVLA